MIPPGLIVDLFAGGGGAAILRDGQRSRPAMHPNGCICPPGAEAGCRGPLCPRRAIGEAT